ncbi:MAG: hypothetical protein MJ078_01510 [Clostridia bacterium]|nr:hypothetical protein [Clostridia bacterium]
MKRALLKTAGYLCCTVPAALASLEFFPVWLADRTQTISVFGIIVLFLTVLPFWKGVKRFLQSPSLWVLWLILLLGLLLLRSIAEELITVSAIAFPTSLLGALFFKLAEKERRKD